jgi:hypothetical protein
MVFRDFKKNPSGTKEWLTSLRYRYVTRLFLLPLMAAALSAQANKTNVEPDWLIEGPTKTPEPAELPAGQTAPTPSEKPVLPPVQPVHLAAAPPPDAASIRQRARGSEVEFQRIYTRLTAAQTNRRTRRKKRAARRETSNELGKSSRTPARRGGGLLISAFLYRGSAVPPVWLLFRDWDPPPQPVLVVPLVDPPPLDLAARPSSVQTLPQVKPGRPKPAVSRGPRPFLAASTLKPSIETPNESKKQPAPATPRFDERAVTYAAQAKEGPLPISLSTRIMPATCP